MKVSMLDNVLPTRRFAGITPLALAVAFSMLGGFASAETAEEAILRLHEKSLEFPTSHFTQVITTTSQMVDSKSVSEVWQKREADGTIKMRTEMESEMTMKGMDMPPTVTKAITVMDGEFVWSEIENPGMSMVTKMKVPPETQRGLEYLVDFVQQGNGRLLDPETIDGKQCVVIEYNMDDMAGSMTVVHRAWIAEENGMMLKSSTKGGELGGDTEMVIKDVRTNIDIDPAKFTYTPPEGAQVMDYTGM